MNRVIPAYVLQAKQRKANARERFEEENQRLEAHTRDTYCCTLITTGAHPEHDTHLCLRKKGHKGYHQDKNTGFNWKWETPNDQL
ncbi:hypothetical protein ACL1IT_01105 [Corynebacterium striatum]|nr:hypothetical protein [Corynebacterium striatum]HAT1238620.1 hypothetical protein [Corynebacterium striatum]HAT1327012.1 hypothetical protein [Corynebacterium striatum]HAT1352028.1 hypothetical protein [Corynebacterium striatum]HAT1400387.1 hypothetical protein [Corynebacterium striatum]